jgi:O-antigen biosynthesis protein
VKKRAKTGAEVLAGPLEAIAIVADGQERPARGHPRGRKHGHKIAGEARPAWVDATSEVAAAVEQTALRLQEEINSLRSELRKLQGELSQTDRRNRVALSFMVPPKSKGLRRFIPENRKQPAWVREQIEGLRKSRLFDAAWYLAQYPDVQNSGADPLSHYVLIGGFEGRKPNPVFDSKWYIETYGDVAQSGLNPLFHYMKFGVAERRGAGPEFDTQYYLERNTDVAASPMNPLVHYLRHGQKEGRIAVRGRPLAQRPQAPADEQWGAIKPARPAGPPGYDVIVPVYRGYDDTLACLYSVLTAPTVTPFELVVINDCSPDERLTFKLRELAGMGLFTLLINHHNLGFVQSVNRGMALHGDRDVILLNSDTVVYNDWLDRLKAQAEASDVGTITPLSSNATICSYPTTLRNNPEQLEIDYAALDKMAADVNARMSVDIPTAVGFCMYIRRACLKAAGLFDAETFGKGYGEENDFCRRAAYLGWRNILAADVYVRHTGEVSFADTAAATLSGALDALVAKHPDYNKVVRIHIRQNPAASVRRRLDAARLRAHTGEKSILHVSHNWGGGIDRHIRSLIRMLRRDGTGGLLMTASERGKPLVNIYTTDDLHVPNLQGLDFNTEAADIAEVLKLAGITRIHIHSIAGWPLEATSALRKLAQMAGVPYDFTMHDYMAFCPRITFVNGRGRYCGEKGLAACHTCIAVNGTPFGRVNATQWRHQFLHLLDGANNIFGPSRDACERTSGYLDGRKVLLRPHPQSPKDPGLLAQPWKPGETLRLMMVGAINEQKGSRLLLNMADDAAKRELPVEFIIVGHTDQDSAFAARANVSMTGRYRETELFEKMAAQAAHAVFFSSVWPETFSYVITSLLDAGYPVAAFDIGAQAERLREFAPTTSLLLDIELAASAGQVNRALLTWMRSLKLPAAKPRVPAVSYTVDDYYGNKT